MESLCLEVEPKSKLIKLDKETPDVIAEAFAVSEEDQLWDSEKSEELVDLDPKPIHEQKPIHE